VIKITLSRNYTEIRNNYVKYRENRLIAEKDEMVGIFPLSIKDLNPKPKPTKSINHIKPIKPTVLMTPKRAKVFFVRDYLRGVIKLSARGLARKLEGIYRDSTKKPDKQLVRDFTVILNDLVDLGILKRRGSIRGVPYYEKIINPNKLKELRNT